jgi:hypothetical protein
MPPQNTRAQVAVTSIDAFEVYYRQIGALGAQIAALETALDSHPELVVVCVARVNHAWAVLDAELNLATAIMDPCEINGVREDLRALPSVQRMREQAADAVRRCLVDGWTAQALVAQVEQLSARLGIFDGDREPLRVATGAVPSVLLTPIASPPNRKQHCRPPSRRHGMRRRSRRAGRLAS